MKKREIELANQVNEIEAKKEVMTVFKYLLKIF